MDEEMREIVVREEAKAVAESRAMEQEHAAAGPAACVDCAALLRQLVLVEEQRQRAVDQALASQSARDQALEALDKVNADLLVAIVERDMRIKDEALRAQRVDVEALRFKVAEMKKNLTTVDARADERFATQLREKDIACERRLAESLKTERDGVQIVLATAKAAVAELNAVREGEQARVEALNAALELIWAAGRRDKGAPRNSHELVAALTQVLSAARVHVQ